LVQIYGVAVVLLDELLPYWLLAGIILGPILANKAEIAWHVYRILQDSFK